VNNEEDMHKQKGGLMVMVPIRAEEPSSILTPGSSPRGQTPTKNAFVEILTKPKSTDLLKKATKEKKAKEKKEKKPRAPRKPKGVTKSKKVPASIPKSTQKITNKMSVSRPGEDLVTAKKEKLPDAHKPRPPPVTIPDAEFDRLRYLAACNKATESMLFPHFSTSSTPMAPLSPSDYRNNSDGSFQNHDGTPKSEYHSAPETPRQDVHQYDRQATISPTSIPSGMRDLLH